MFNWGCCRPAICERSDFVVECDVTEERSLEAVFAAVGERWGRLDFAVHAIGSTDPNALRGKYVDTTRENFARTLDISCFSFTDICRRAVFQIFA